MAISSHRGIESKRYSKNSKIVHSLVVQSSKDSYPIKSILLLHGGKETKKESSSPSIATTLRNVLKYIRKLLFPQWNSIKTKTSSKKSVSTSDNDQRIQRELKNFMESPPHNCEVSVGSNIRIWVVTLTGIDGSVYAGEKYKLKFVFPKDYPSKPPGVYFLKPTPKHQHVYSNGDICLNLLGKDWRPTMTAELIAVSILSMLSSAKEKTTPQDNAMHADAAPGQKQENWMYHDDKC
jgi:ubiquitin-conjugating enzyme E2 W